MKRYVCIHGHFYQPPRENPWLEAIEVQHSSYPYHDWNERITAECYEPNSASRILDKDKRISEIVNNYVRISFNFGPTLLAWMEQASPTVYQKVLRADKESQEVFSGHGSALAQVYNHVIMPLANHRDKYTQVRWGIRDFESRFGRRPEGMWLPETAVDLETLDVLAEQGIKFTVLAQNQAEKVRRLGTTRWEDVSGGRIDPTRAYEARLASGRKIGIFFYDGPISRAIAFEGLLENGESFVDRLKGAFSGHRDWPQLVHIATDGESYGHHHRHGDMALAYALGMMGASPDIEVTNYGEFLEKHPPTHEVRVIEKTSWSCYHGVDRWWRDCGCNSGGHQGWNQAWRTPLRQALDWLRDELAPKYESSAKCLLNDPWAARDDYIEVVRDRSNGNVDNFLLRHANHKLDTAERVEVFKLLELQRQAMLMYTSCGWFFDELSGIETVQVIQFAGRVVQLSEELFGDSTEEQFLMLLEQAKCNVVEHGDGRRLYEKFVKPAAIDLIKVAAHYAISSLFEEYVGEKNRVFCFDVEVHDYKRENCGNQRIAVGYVKVTSRITGESKVLSIGVVHLGHHNIQAGVRPYRGEEAYQEMLKDLTTTCSAADFPGVIRLLDRHFGSSTYSLRSLFRDEQDKVLGNILASTLGEIEAEYRKIYQAYYPLMRFLAELGDPLPEALKAAAELILNNDLRRVLTADAVDQEAANKLLKNAQSWGISLESTGLAHVCRQRLERNMTNLAARPKDSKLLVQMLASVKLAQSMPFAVELRGVQNLFHEMLKAGDSEFQNTAIGENRASRERIVMFMLLGDLLSMRIS